MGDVQPPASYEDSGIHIVAGIGGLQFFGSRQIDRAGPAIGSVWNTASISSAGYGAAPIRLFRCFLHESSANTQQGRVGSMEYTCRQGGAALCSYECLGVKVRENELRGHVYSR